MFWTSVHVGLGEPDTRLEDPQQLAKTVGNPPQRFTTTLLTRYGLMWHTQDDGAEDILSYSIVLITRMQSPNSSNMQSLIML